MSSGKEPKSSYLPPTSSEPVAPIAHEADQQVRVRRGELREWAAEAEEVVRNPIEAPTLWKAVGISLSMSAVFFGLSLIPATAGKGQPNVSSWEGMATVVLFLGGMLIFAFTAHLERDVKRANMSRAQMLAAKMRYADERTPLLGATRPTGPFDPVRENEPASSELPDPAAATRGADNADLRRHENPIQVADGLAALRIATETFDEERQVQRENVSNRTAFDRETKAIWMLRHRDDALDLFDKAHDLRVVAKSERDKVENPLSLGLVAKLFQTLECRLRETKAS